MEVFGLSIRLREEGAAAVEGALKKLRLSTLLTSVSIGTTLTLALRKLVTETSAAQAGQAQLAAALKSTGGVAGQTQDALNAHAAALQETTMYGDDAVNAAQALLLTFTKIQGDTFPKATEAVLNVASAMGTDLQSAAIQVGKALNDPILGVSALARSGIQFTESQKETIKALVETGRQAEAQRIILAELETQFGGSAKAARNTLGGALAALNNAFGDLFEVSRESSSGIIDAIESITAALPKMRNAINDTFLSWGVLMAQIELGFTKSNRVIHRLNAQIAQMALIASRGTVGAKLFADQLVLLTKAEQDVVALEALVAERQKGIATAYAAGTKAVAAQAGAMHHLSTTAQDNIDALVQLAKLTALTTDEYAALTTAEQNIATQLARGNVPLEQRVELLERQRGLLDAITTAEVQGERARLAQLEGTMQRRGVTRLGDGLGIYRESIIPPGLTRGITQGMNAEVVKQVEVEAIELGNTLRDTFAENISDGLADGIAGGFAAVTAPGGTIGTAFNAFSGLMLGALGDAMIKFGTASVGFAKLQEKIKAGLTTLTPATTIKAAVAMIALGGALKGAAAGMFQRGTGGTGLTSIGGGGISTSLGVGAMTSPTQLIFGQTSATTAAGMTPRSATNVTIIGPDDPKAQRAIEELIRKGQTRGTLG